ncbi:MAG: hypothetical protein WBV36_05990 [Terriglobales bacterium]
MPGGVVTGPCEAARYAAAWRDRRRRMLVFAVVSNAVVPVLFVVAYFHLRLNPLLFISAFLIAFAIAAVWVNRFRCPRCGKLYYWKWRQTRLKNWRDCRHCGLAQDAVPI